MLHSNHDHDGRNLLNRLLFPVTLFLICLYAFILRVPAINPDSLWYDDAWVALAAKASTFQELWELGRSSPIGFTFINYLMPRIIPDIEIAGQIVPLAASLLLIPVVALLILYMTQSRATAIAGAGVCAVSPILLLYSTRVKQYTIDALATSLLLLLLFRMTQDNFSIRHYLYLFLASLLFLPFSHTSFFIGFLFVNIAALCVFIHNYKNKIVILYLALLSAVYNSLLLAYYFFVLSRQSKPHLKNFWADEFLPWQSGIEDVLHYFIYKFPIILGAFPTFQVIPIYFWGIFYVFFILGAMLFFLQNRKFWLMGIVSVLVMVMALVLSALKIYPLGGGRVDAYLHPLLIIWFVLGAFHYCQLLGLPQKWLKIAMGCGLAFILAAGTVQAVSKNHPYHYRDNGALYVQKLEQAYQKRAGVLIFPMDSYLFGLYTTWSYQFDFSRTCRSWICTENPDVYVMPHTRNFRSEPEELFSRIQWFVENDYPVLLYMGTHSRGEFDAFLKSHLKTRGYRLIEEDRDRGSVLMTFEKI